VDTLDPSSPVSVVSRVCVFCRDEIHPGATVCCHCGSSLAPLQTLAEQNAEFEERLAALEREFAFRRDVTPGQNAATEAVFPDQGQTTSYAGTSTLSWPHMADNILVGLTALLTAHWIATTLPIGNRTVFRIVALLVALPFGFRFESNARSGITGQIVAALAFASLGTLLIGVVDLLVRPLGNSPVVATDVVASFATVALSHYAGSALAHFRQSRNERRASHKAVAQLAASAATSSGALVQLAPAQLKTTAEAVKAVYDAAAPLAAGGAALWAAIGHLFV
jgi:hypothetical protein